MLCQDDKPLKTDGIILSKSIEILSRPASTHDSHNVGNSISTGVPLCKYDQPSEECNLGEKCSFPNIGKSGVYGFAAVHFRVDGDFFGDRTERCVQSVGVRKRPAQVRKRPAAHARLIGSESRPSNSPPPNRAEPYRLRIVSSNNTAGGDLMGNGNPQRGVDLYWEGDRWTSLVFSVLSGRPLSFRLARVFEEDESVQGKRQRLHPQIAFACRRFDVLREYTIHTPLVGEVLEIRFECCKNYITAVPRTEVFKYEHHPSCVHLGTQEWVKGHRCFTFYSPGGLRLHYWLHLPQDYKRQNRKWPLIVYFHALHSFLYRDNSLFHNHDAPTGLLTGMPGCPSTLRDEFVVLVPQCPPDPARTDGSGLWLRRGFDPTFYMPEMEEAIASLIETVTSACEIDKDRIAAVGTSMGGYACLELCSRWQRFFSCAVVVASYYDDCIEELAFKLAMQQAMPMWFFHSTNDKFCPHRPIKQLVQKLKTWTKAEVRFTSMSKFGHDIECVAFPNLIEDSVLDRPAMGDEVFSWILKQRKEEPPQRRCDQCLKDSIAGRAGWGDEEFDGKWYCSTCWPYWE